MIVWSEYAWLGGDEVTAGVSIEIEDGRIAAVTPDSERPAAATALRGVTLPGLANVHSHAFQRVLRGRTQRRRGTFWTWREAMYGAAEALTPDDYRVLAAATFGEMALAGITVVGEFHYVHHQADGHTYDDPNAMSHAIVDGAAAAGVRLTLLDACYLHGGIGAELAGTQLRFGDGSAEAWAERVDAMAEGRTVRIGAAAHSVRALAPDELAVVASWARERSKPLHAHVSEQPRENEDCIAAYGRSPVQVLEEAGCVDEGFCAVHATHVSERDRETLGAAASTCGLCPTTERDLADGVGRADELRAAGASLALGTDSNAVIDMFEETRAVELDQRLVGGERAVNDPAELLSAATAGGYSALGWDGGAIRPGACADLVAVGLESVRLAGTPDAELVPAIVFAAHPSDVTDVLVDGEWVVRDGRHLKLDVAGELKRALS